MVRLKHIIALSVLAMTGLTPAWATTYSQFLDAGGWRADTSVFACELSHSVPHYGAAVFATRAGERSQFHLSAQSSRMQSGKAALLARSPVWMEQSVVVDLGEVAVEQGLRPVVLAAAPTERMLSELYNGRELIFARDAWYGDQRPTEVTITTVGFRTAYERYLQCLSGLLPVNFDQIKRTAVYFGSNQFENIRSAELSKLDNIVAYVKADPTVKEFFIDGHTDSVGTREDNLALAEKRAEEVTRYLVNKGVPASAIISRWHGERYPVAENDTGDNRAKNRRVTIRLERVLPPPG